MSSPKFTPIAFVNSDVLIKAFVQDDKPTITKLLNLTKEMNIEAGEKFLITEFVINDVISVAYRNGTAKNKVLKYLSSGKTMYFQPVSVPSYILKHAMYLLDISPNELTLTLTDWTALIMMLEMGVDTIVSDREELDEVIKDPAFHTLFKEGMKRI